MWTVPRRGGQRAISSVETGRRGPALRFAITVVRVGRRASSFVIA